MMVIADILKAGEKLTAVAPFLAGIQNDEQYAEALAFVDHLLLNDPDNPLLDLVCAKISAWENASPEFAEFNAQRNAMPAGLSVIRTLMDQYGLTLSDLPEIGSKSMARVKWATQTYAGSCQKVGCPIWYFTSVIY